MLKVFQVNKLAKFLSNMSDMDVCRLLEKVENVENVDNLVWNIALSKLDSSFASQAVAFLSHQVCRSFKVLLDYEKNSKVDLIFKF